MRDTGFSKSKREKTAYSKVFTYIKEILLDKVVIMMMIALLCILLLNKVLFIKILEGVGLNLKAIWLYLVFTFSIGAYLEASKVTLLITKTFKKYPLVTIMLGSVFGAIVPLCSCTVIPLITVLLRSGLPLSGIMSFWISSPVSSIDLFVLTTGILGIEFATVRMITSIFMGIFAGGVTYLLMKYAPFMKAIDHSKDNVNLGDVKGVKLKIWEEKERIKVFFINFVKQVPFVLKWLVLAFMVEVFMIEYVPPEILSGFFGDDNVFAIPASVLIGIPAYVNNIATLPVLKVFLSKGVSHGATLAFMAAGAATSIPAMTAVWGVAKKRVFVVYLISALLSSMIAGYVYQFVYTNIL